MMVDYVRKMTVKNSCNYEDYGWFEHLLFLLIYLLDLCTACNAAQNCVKMKSVAELSQDNRILRNVLPDSR